MAKHLLRVVLSTLVLAWLSPSAISQEIEGKLTLVGKVQDGEVVLSREAIAALPQVTLTEQHVSMKAPATFKGPYVGDVLALAKASGSSIKMLALDDYVASASIADIEKYRPILAMEMDGKLMTVRDFGPYFLIWPFSEHQEVNTDVFHANAVWQLIRIEVE
jgi:hypothetical protein